MTELNYQLAVKKSVSLFSSMRDVQGQNWHTPSGASFLLNVTIGAKHLRDDIEGLIKKAKSDHYYFQALKFGIAHSLKEGNPLPEQAVLWLAEYLLGKTIEPKQKQGRANSDIVHLHICMQIFSLVNDGMQATRNDTSPQISACDAVADALKALNLSPKTYEGVKRIWIKNKKRISHGVPPT